jgi:hypothetical protein
MIVLRPEAALYYYVSESCFLVKILEATQHKPRKPKELCLAQRRQDRKGEEHCHPAFLTLFASPDPVEGRLGERTGFWLRPEAALGFRCALWQNNECWIPGVAGTTSLDLGVHQPLHILSVFSVSSVAKNLFAGSLIIGGQGVTGAIKSRRLPVFS